jgi:hypothetical protein
MNGDLNENFNSKRGSLISQSVSSNQTFYKNTGVQNSAQAEM